MKYTFLGFHVIVKRSSRTLFWVFKYSFRVQSYYKFMNFQSFLREKFMKYSKFIVTFAEKYQKKDEIQL